MNAEELEQLESRLQKFNSAKNDVSRYVKLQSVLEAIPDGEHTVGAIIIDVQRKEFRYESNDSRRAGLVICSMNRTDHEEFFAEILSWAREKINDKLEAAMAAMIEA